MAGDVCQNSLKCNIKGWILLYVHYAHFQKETWHHPVLPEMFWVREWESYICSASFAYFFFFSFSFSPSFLLSFFPALLPSFLASLLPPSLTRSLPSLLPSSPFSPESLRSPCPCQAGGRPLSPKHFQHCHYKLVGMIRHPGRLIPSLLQGGSCSAKLASDPQRRLARPQGSLIGLLCGFCLPDRKYAYIRWKRGNTFPRIAWPWEEGVVICLCPRKISFALEFFCSKPLAAGLGVRGCSRGEKKVEGTGKADATLPWGSSKRSPYHLKPLKGWRERRKPSPSQFLPGSLTPRAALPSPNERWTEKLTGQAGSRNGNRRRDWHGSLRWACRGPVAAGTSICYAPPLVGSQEGKGTMTIQKPLAQKYTRKWAAGPTCPGVNHMRVTSQGSLGQSPPSNRELWSPSAKKNASWVQPSATQPHGQWEGLGMPAVSKSCLLEDERASLRELDACTSFFFFFSFPKDSWYPGGKAYHSITI